MRVRHVMHEEQQIVRTRLERFVHRAHRPAVLADESGAGRDRAIHADALVVGAVPLSPAVALGRFDGDAVVIADDVGQRLQPERAGVVLVGRPRVELDAA